MTPALKPGDRVSFYLGEADLHLPAGHYTGILVGWTLKSKLPVVDLDDGVLSEVTGEGRMPVRRSVLVKA